MPTEQERQLVDVAVEAAHAAGAVLLRQAGAVRLLHHKSTDTDPVTEADLAAERAVVAVLGRARPDDGLVGEEGATRPSGTGLRWVVDPMDGTTNYLYGLPHYAVSIACERQVGAEPDGRPAWRPVVGVVYDPVLTELFTAIHGQGARLDGKPIRVNDPVPLATALVATGFAYDPTSRARQASTVASLLPRARDIRSHGSAALALCWVAAGRWDAYYEDELATWDWAAGALIAREAGAAVSPLNTGVLAASPTLHRHLAGLVTRPDQVTTATTTGMTAPPTPRRQG
ncbi:inositol monophosphatase family protein [Micromonospora sp. KC723]|uniref:inositol monophosphatase family protein n=1 Tax=Micromonospora sp. KC723 TaxID=2530381 RepID=UPI0010530D5F|nr:inositol monophosphatase family protein [Micromonospora sp. KC723]TDB78472.1 inositol monophosphatase [Micromonospora sp. KC723]